MQPLLTLLSKTDRRICDEEYIDVTRAREKNGGMDVFNRLRRVG